MDERAGLIWLLECSANVSDSQLDTFMSYGNGIGPEKVRQGLALCRRLVLHAKHISRWRHTPYEQQATACLLQKATASDRYGVLAELSCAVSQRSRVWAPRRRCKLLLCA